MSQAEFTTQGVAETRRRLLKNLAAGPGLLLVQGPSGCGKSHLKRQLSGPLSRRFTLIDLPYSRLDPQQFTATVTRLLDPGAPSPADSIICLQPRLNDCAQAGRPLLLLIDDIQFMPAETRALLADLAPGGASATPPVYGILFADPGLGSHFSLLPGADPEGGLQQRLTLPPPVQADMARFLTGLLGEGTGKSLSNSAQEAIIEQARGNLRRLRQLAEIALLEQTHEQRPVTGPEWEPLAARREGSGGRFAFGLVDGDDFQGPGPDLVQAPMRGNELDALTAQSETPADRSQTTALVTAVRDRSDLPAVSRRRLTPGLLTVGGLALALLLLNPPSLEENAWLQRLFAREQATPMIPASSQPQRSATAVPKPAALVPGKGAAVSRVSPTAGVASPTLDAARWLIRAREHEAAYRLTLPADDNAILSYRRVLEIDPDNFKARGALERIQALYRRRGNQALKQSEWEKARHNFARLLWINSDDRGATAALARLPTGSEQTQSGADQQARQQQPQQ